MYFNVQTKAFALILVICQSFCILKFNAHFVHCLPYTTRLACIYFVSFVSLFINRPSSHSSGCVDRNKKMLVVRKLCRRLPYCRHIFMLMFFKLFWLYATSSCVSLFVCTCDLRGCQANNELSS